MKQSIESEARDMGFSPAAASVLAQSAAAMTALDSYSARALAAHAAKAEETDSLMFDAAGFAWDHETNRYEVTVRGHVVAMLRTLAQVTDFSAMHNDGVFGSRAN